MNGSSIEILVAARRIADYAKEEGALAERRVPRVRCNHMGGVLADAVLQAGLNYATVVRPRVQTILRKFPERDRISMLVELVAQQRTASFLNWTHPLKVARFERLVEFLDDRGVEHVDDLHSQIRCSNFCADLRNINGVGPKTIDYMACLVGVDSVAVDRHIRAFAKHVGIDGEDYKFLQTVFCCAADLLSLPRRDFDAWIWQKQSASKSNQFSLTF